MKKTIALIGLLAASFCIFIVIMSNQHTVCFQESDNGIPNLAIKFSSGQTETITPWYDETADIWYYFLPAHIQKNEVWCGNLERILFIDNMVKERTFSYIEGQEYQFIYNANSYSVIFRNTTNISTIFISTDSGSLDFIHSNKDNTEAGEVLAVSEKGRIEYAGDLERISGHGNGSWSAYPKKPYHIKLSSKGQPGGLEAGREWYLLALWFEGDKIHSKVAYDMAKILGSEYSPASTWVNLYINGDYRGLYLITESFKDKEIFNTGVDAFLFEKESPSREDDVYRPSFYTDNDYLFTIVRPKSFHKDTLNQMTSLIQNAEDSIYAHDYESVIDTPSFVTQFLIDEISLNYDAFVTSTYMYKPAGDSKLYAGPAWDYDGAFTEHMQYGTEYSNPQGTVLNRRDAQLDWYAALHETEPFKKEINRQLTKALPELNELFEKKIPLYRDLISDSAANDDIRWRQSYILHNTDAGIYHHWENDIRFLQYFSLNRINYLYDKYQVEGERSGWIPENISHTLRFMVDGRLVYSMEIRDGNVLKTEEIDALNSYKDGYWWPVQGMVHFSEYLPILEDCTFEYRIPENN